MNDLKIEIKFTTEQWLNKLPLKHRNKALKNMNHAVRNIEHVSITDALFAAFDLGASSEGLDYWHNVLMNEFNKQD